MPKNTIRTTVLFEDPFWVGIVERSSLEGYAVAKKIFGVEPTNNEVYHFLLKNFNSLRFSKSQASEEIASQSKTKAARSTKRVTK